MNIKVPINNTIEIIVADLFINFQCKLMPQIPVSTVEGKLALGNIEAKINEIFSKAVYEAKKKLEENLE